MNKPAIRKTILLLALLAPTFLFVSANRTFSQQTANSTQAAQTDDQKRAALVSALERAQAEVKAGRVYISGLKEQVASTRAQIAALAERDQKRIELQTLLESQVAELKSAVAAQKEGEKILRSEIDYLKKELSKIQKKLKAAHKRERVLAATSAGLFILLLLLNR